MTELHPGTVAWADLDPTRDREQAGRRPVLVVSAAEHLALVTSMAVVVPISSVDRGWPNHVEVVTTDGRSVGWAITEQPRTVTRARLTRAIGVADDRTRSQVQTWLADFLGLDVRIP